MQVSILGSQRKNNKEEERKLMKAEIYKIGRNTNRTTLKSQTLFIETINKIIKTGKTDQKTE